MKKLFKTSGVILLGLMVVCLLPGPGPVYAASYWQSISERFSATAGETLATGWHIFSIECSGTTSCTPYIDGVAGTAVSTNLPDDEELAITAHLQNGEAAAKWMEMDYIQVIQDR
jgi:hypothetical protein